MPLRAGKSDKIRNQNIRTLEGEVGESPHVQSRAQAIAIGYAKQRASKQRGGRSIWRPGSSVQALDTVPSGTKPWVEAVGGGDRQRGLPSDDPNYPASSEYANYRTLQQGLPGYEPITDQSYPSAAEPGYQGGGPIAAPAVPAAAPIPYIDFPSAPPPSAPPPPRHLPPAAAMPHGPPSTGAPTHHESPSNAGDLVRNLKKFYDHYGELRPDQQRRLMEMLGQPLDQPSGMKPEIDWDELQKHHDLSGAMRERPVYHPPYRGAEGGGSIGRAIRLASGGEGKVPDTEPAADTAASRPAGAPGPYGPPPGPPSIRGPADIASTAMRIARQAGGANPIALPLMGQPGDAAAPAFKGPIKSHIPGRTDKINLDVKPGSYVWPADVVSSLGEGNSAAGQHLLQFHYSAGKSLMGGMKPPQGGHGMLPGLHFLKGKMKAPQAGKHAVGGDTPATSEGNVPIVAAGGEHVTPPEDIVAKFGSLDHGHKVFDEMVKQAREQEIERLKTAPPPKK